MVEIKTLQNLKNVVGEDFVRCLFTEYLMELIGKSDTLDGIRTVVENGGSLDEVKELLWNGRMLSVQD